MISMVTCDKEGRGKRWFIETEHMHTSIIKADAVCDCSRGAEEEL